jgi:hypothetical protein
MIDLALGVTLIVVVFGLALLDLRFAIREYAKLGIADEELEKMNAKGSKAYWQRIVDIFFFLLLAFLIQSFASKFIQKTCPFISAYSRILFYSALSLAPFGAGYIWTMLPPGRKGMLDAVLARLGKADETSASRLHRLLWRPWLGVLYFIYYLLVLLSAYLAIRGTF